MLLLITPHYLSLSVYQESFFLYKHSGKSYFQAEGGVSGIIDFPLAHGTKQQQMFHQSQSTHVNVYLTVHFLPKKKTITNKKSSLLDVENKEDMYM